MIGDAIIEVMRKAGRPPHSTVTEMLIGEVKSISPLIVRVDDRYDLDDKFLIRTTLVVDFDVDMTVDHMTEKVSGGSGDSAYAAHDHPYQGRKTFRVHLGLQVGEKVLLMRVQNGQKFIIIDRVR